MSLKITLIFSTYLIAYSNLRILMEMLKGMLPKSENIQNTLAPTFTPQI